MSDQDKIHTILLEKIAGLEKQVKDRQDLIDYKNSQMAKAHLAITQNFGAGASTQEGLVLDVRIKAIAQDVHEKMEERNTCNAKLWEEATPYLDEDTKGKSWPQVIKILAAKLRASDEQNRIRHIYQRANESLGGCVDGLRKEKAELEKKLKDADSLANRVSAGAHLLLTQHGIPQGNLKDRVLHVLQTCHKLNTEIEDANNFLSKGWGIPEDTSLCKRINHLAQGYNLKADELGLKLTQERTATDGALKAIQNVNEILDNVGVPGCGVLAVRIGALLSKHRNEVEELKRTQLARREKAKAHKDGELARAQETLKYCQDKLQGIYPDHRLSLRELVDSAVLAIRYAGPRSVVSQENDKLRARIEHLEKNEKEQADAYARQWDSIRPTLAVLGAVDELPPCWPDIILELADRLTKTKEKLWQCRMELHRVESVCPVAHGPTWERVQKLAEMYNIAMGRISYLESELAKRPKSADPMDASVECMKKFFDSHPHISSVKATYCSSGLYEFLWDNGHETEFLKQGHYPWFYSPN